MKSIIKIISIITITASLSLLGARSLCGQEALATPPRASEFNYKRGVEMAQAVAPTAPSRALAGFSLPSRKMGRRVSALARKAAVVRVGPVAGDAEGVLPAGVDHLAGN